MKTKIYNNLIFSLLFVCSICGLLGGVSVSAQQQGATTCHTGAEEIFAFLQGLDGLGGDLGSILTPDSIKLSINKTTSPEYSLTKTFTDSSSLPCDTATIIRNLYRDSNLKNTITPPDPNDPGEDAVLVIKSTDEKSPTTRNPASKSIKKGDPAILHLYSDIWGEGAQTIKATDTNQKEVSGLIRKFFNRFLRIIFTVSGILMVIMLAVHGTRMIYAEFTGNVPGFADAKSRVKAAAIGTIILLLSWIILDFIDPSLLRPRLFETITSLQRVGQSNNLIAFDITIPNADERINYDKDSKTLTIEKVCPEIKPGSSFELQVENNRKSLQQGPNSNDIPLQYSYQVLYSNTEGTTYVHDGEKSVPYEIFAGIGRNKDNYVGLIECDKKNPPQIKLDGISNADVIVVFPIVSILANEQRRIPNSEKTETVAVLKKFWRGRPWRGENKDAQIIAEVQKHLTSVAVSCQSSTTFEIKENSGLGAKYKYFVRGLRFRVDGVQNLKNFKIEKSFALDHKIHFPDRVDDILKKHTAYDASGKSIAAGGFSLLQLNNTIEEGFESELYLNKDIHRLCVTLQIPANYGLAYDENNYTKVDLNTHCFRMDWTKTPPTITCSR